MGLLGTSASVVSDLTLGALLAATAAITYGWLRARAGDGTTHHTSMIASVILAWLFFLGYMLGRLLDTGGTFRGPEGLLLVYWYPLVAIHSATATVTLVWGLFQIRNGYRNARRITRRYWDMTGERRRRHARLGRAYLAFWYVTTATGVLVYLSLYVIWT